MRQETLLKIIGLLRKDIYKGQTILEISKKLKIGYRPAYNHITEMEKQEIIIVKRIGMSKQCFLNLKNAKCRHLLEEVDMLRQFELFKRKPILEKLTVKLTDRFTGDIHSIILFGSYAKGRETKTSDIDLLFIVADLKNKNIREGIERECGSFQYSHNTKISPLITDVVEFKKMLDAKELNVGKEAREYGMPLYGSEFFWRLIL